MLGGALMLESMFLPQERYLTAPLGVKGARSVYVDDFGDFYVPDDAAELLRKVQRELDEMPLWTRFKRWLGLKGTVTLDEAHAKFWIADQVSALRQAFMLGREWKPQTLAEWRRSNSHGQ